MVGGWSDGIDGWIGTPYRRSFPLYSPLASIVCATNFEVQYLTSKSTIENYPLNQAFLQNRFQNLFKFVYVCFTNHWCFLQRSLKSELYISKQTYIR
jgi:hypothetical protein